MHVFLLHAFIPHSLFETLQTPIWIFDFDCKQIIWANKQAFPLWETSNIDELTSRLLGEGMSQAVEAILDDYRHLFEQGETIRTWWNFTPKTVSKSALCLFLLDKSILNLRQSASKELELPGNFPRASSRLSITFSFLISFFFMSFNSEFKNAKSNGAL